MAEDVRQRAAGAEQLDLAYVICIGDDGELEGRLQRGVGVADQRGERRGERAVLDADGLRDAFLRADMAALIGDGGQLVITVGLGRGVEGEGEREIGRAGGEVKMV